MKPKRKVAVLGAGKWGANLIRNVSFNDEIEFTGICDSDPETLKKISGHYPHVPAFDTYERMLEAGPDAVIIATPARRHYEHARKALLAGRHVLIEKPMAATPAEARELAALAREKSVVLMVGHTFLYNNIVHEIKRRLDGRELGDVYYVYSRRLNLGHVRQDVDVMWNLAPHDISIINYLLSSRPQKVSAQGLSFIQKQKNISDVAFCKMDYPDGRSAHLHLSWIDPQKVRQLVIVGSEKMLVYDDTDPDKHIQIYDKSVEKKFTADVSDFADFSTRIRAGDLVIPNIRLTEPLSVEISHFVECTRNGTRPRTDSQNGLEVVCVLQALSDSLADGGSVAEVNYLSAS